tara:strand:+ start:2166 stop:2681 length:516 start_codon:yes stop_codon:yes gene_type:complete
MALTTREQYENEIARIQSLINKAKVEENYWTNKQASDMRSHCAGMDNWCGGITCCERWKRDATIVNRDNATKYRNAQERHKQELWDYQKRIAQEEQEAQIKAVREAIAEQVRIEQEKILEQQKAEQALEKQTAIIEQTTFVNENIQTKETQEQIKSSSLLPLAIVAGVLLL